MGEPKKSRRQLWIEFDALVAKGAAANLAPAFIQQAAGQWSVQVLVRRVPSFGAWHRFFSDPPNYDLTYCPYYTGWPGDSRGWMRFPNAQCARDFYKFATRRMTFEEYRETDLPPTTGERYDLDNDGNFIEARAS